MKKIIAIIAVIALLLGGKVYLEYRYDKGMQQAVQVMSPFAAMTYDDIYIGLNGSIIVTGVKVSSALMKINEDIYMEKVEFSSSDKFGLLTGRLFKNESYPSTLGIKYTNIDVPVSAIENSGDKGCSSIGESIDLAELGYSRLRGDIIVNADFSSKKNSRIMIDMDYKNFGEISFNVKADVTRFNIDKARRGIFPIKKLEFINRNNESFGTDLINYCAQKLNMEPEQYLNDVVSSPKYTKSFGLVLGAGLNQALVQDLKGGQELTLSIEPSKPETNFSQIRFYNTEAITKILNFQVALDGVPIEDMSFQKYSLDDKEALENIAKLEAATKNGEDGEVSQEPEAPGFKVVKFNELNDHLGAEVRIERVGIQAIKGTLRSYKGGVVKIDQYRYGGQVTFPVSRKEIAKIEVYY